MALIDNRSDIADERVLEEVSVLRKWGEQNMTKLKIERLSEAKVAALKRLLRTIGPQIPAMVAYIVGVKPEWAVTLSAVGALATALDKFCRDMGVY